MTTSREYRPELLIPLLQGLAADGIGAEIIVHGTSMVPTLLAGDRAQMVPATAAETRIGDVVVRAEATKPIIHRLVGWWPTRGGWRMLTKGDGARRLDPPVHPEDVLGRVVARVRGGEICRMDSGKMRFRGLGRAAASLVEGLMVEMWDRGYRMTNR